MIKRIVSLLMIISICFTSGCSSKKRINQNKEANIILENLIIALKDSDSQSVKELFSLNVQSGWEDLDQQITQMLDYFNGDIISYDTIRTVAGGEVINDGELTYSGIRNAKSEKVITSEATYTISFTAVLVDDNENNIGVWRIWIGKSDEDYMIIGNSDMPLS